MTKIERKLESYVDKEMTHCGHEPDRTKAANEGVFLLRFIAREIDKLVEKAGLP